MQDFKLGETLTQESRIIRGIWSILSLQNSLFYIGIWWSWRKLQSICYDI